jgi:hypothetical protein
MYTVIILRVGTRHVFAKGARLWVTGGETIVGEHGGLPETFEVR